MHTLPHFIRSLPRHIKAEDLDYLAKKNALTIPEGELRAELLRNFIQYVHPFMPVVDLDDLLTPMAQPGQGKPVSLLLFQAVMFVSATFLSAESVQKAGFQSCKAARKAFFQRARLLYGLDCETDRLTLIQSLLLMSFWYGSSQDEKDTWHWMGISLSLAQVLGLHRNPDHLDISLRAKRLRRRIWWSCFMRDRMLALGIRRPARIRHEEFSVPMPTLDDFDTTPLPPHLISLIGKSSFAEDTQSRKQVAVACIEMARLCVCTGNVLFSQYSILGNSTVGPQNDTTVMVTPSKSFEQDQELAKCDLELTDWFQSLNPSCQYKATHSKTSKLEDGNERIVHLHQALLHMIYLTAMTALHRPRALQSYSMSVDDGASFRQSKAKVTAAAIGITEIVYDLQSQSQMCYLPPSGIHAILWATLSHLLDIRSVKESVRNTSIGRFYQCMQALEELRKLYASADHAVWFLEAVIKKTDVFIPMLNIGRHVNSKTRKPGISSTETNTLQTARLSAINGGRNNASVNGTGPLPTSMGNDPMRTDLTDDDNTYNDLLRVSSGNGSSYGDRPSIRGFQASPQTSEWNNIDLGDSLHQALISFDNNPGSFAMSSAIDLDIGRVSMMPFGGYMLNSPIQGYDEPDTLGADRTWM